MRGKSSNVRRVPQRDSSVSSIAHQRNRSCDTLASLAHNAPGAGGTQQGKININVGIWHLE